ncbi:5'-nucleotidase C-terminal domain-containing protein [Candidatus Poriferisocius sp.]|uniref:5'-nucleotidase C-terminal domain-containing protein n=1 Tax=Candidatus Poriferisocius sp. TaxID=3101276 RepID=UPI003B0164D8
MKIRRIAWALIALGLAAALLGSVTAGAQEVETTSESSGDLQLVILHHNDGESQLVQASSSAPDHGGVARFASLVHQLRSQAADDGAAVITISSGDNFLSGPELSVSLGDDSPFYDALALNLIGYDALTIGNHEFDLGPDLLARFISETTTAPFISANLDFSGEPALAALVEQGRIAKSTVVEKQGRSIGIIGATTPELTYISSPRNVQVMSNVAEVVQAEIDRLTGDGVDIIVLSTHLQALSSEVDLASHLTGVDAIVAGGSDVLLADYGVLLLPDDPDPHRYGPYPYSVPLSDGTSVPIVTTPGDYTYVGRLVLTIDADGNVTAIDETSGLRRVIGGEESDAVEPHPDVQAQVTEPVAAALAELAATPVGTTEVPLDGRRSPGIRTHETNQGNLLADALLWNSQRLAADFGVPEPAVALQNGGGIRNDSVIPVGPISLLETFNISPFGNLVTVIEDVSPAQVKVLLENAVSRVESSSGRFAQVAGLSFVYDPAGTPQEIGDDNTVTTEGTRVQSITLDDGTALVSDGAVVDGAPSIALVTLNFLANGGDQYLFGDGTRTHLGLTDQQSLASYISDGLNGTIPAAQYPESGEGRITTVAAEMDDMNDGMDDMTGEELPATGTESRLLFLIAAALIIAGLLLAAASHLTTATHRRKRLTV